MRQFTISATIHSSKYRNEVALDPEQEENITDGIELNCMCSVIMLLFKHVATLAVIQQFPT